MIELTAEQIAEGWIAHDGETIPQGFDPDEEVEVMMRGGEVKMGWIDMELSIYSWKGTPEHPLDRIAIRRPSKPAPKVTVTVPILLMTAGEPVKLPIDPNAAMLDADTAGAAAKQARRAAEADRKSYAFFADRPVRPIAANLLMVAAIPRNGFSLWGL